MSDSAKKKVLIITYAWPPKGGVGVMRVLKFAKYLPEFGWVPTVITTNDSAPGSPYRGEDVNIDVGSYKVIRTGYKDILKWAPARLRKTLLVPDMQRGWFGYAFDEAVKLLEKERFDIIFSSSPPETSHLIARSIKKRFGLPWVADMRDLWSMDHFEKENILKRRLSMAIERSVLRDANAVTTVSDPWAGDIVKTNGIRRDKVRLLTNGFDEEDFKDIPSRFPDKFTLTYTGKLHEKMQNPEILFRVLSECVKEGSIDKKRLELRFYALGFKKADIKALAGRYGLTDVVKESGGVDYRESIMAQRDSTMLLFFQWKGSRGWFSAKIYEYLGSRKPILAILEKESVINDLIKDLDAGFAAHTAGELKDVLVQSYKEYLANGFVRSRIKEDALRHYARREITRELAAIFNEFAANPNPVKK